MRTIENFKNEQIDISFSAKLYGGLDGKVKLELSAPADAKLFNGVVVSTTGGTATLSACANTSPVVVECTATITPK